MFHNSVFFLQLYQFAMAVAMAYFTGFFLSLAFEVPVSILESLAVDKIVANLRARRRRKPPKIRVERASIDDKNDVLEDALMKSNTDDIIFYANPKMRLEMKVGI